MTLLDGFCFPISGFIATTCVFYTDVRQKWRFFFIHRHSFALSAPAVSNNIPAVVRDSVNLDTFKTAFKRHLFNCAYTPRHWQWSIGTSDSLLVAYGADQTNPHEW